MYDLKVSIITVCLNSEKTIEQTIRSVLDQTYKNIEYIIVDGQSTDKTLQIIRKYQDRIATCISEPDKGLYDAMNKGISLSTGDVIGIINSDDWYAPDAVENVVRLFAKEKIDVVYGAMEIVHSDGITSKVQNGALEQMLYRMVIPHPTAFVRKGVYQEVGCFNLQYRVVADYDLFLRMYLYRCKFRQTPHVLAYFRNGGLSTVNAVACAEEIRRIARYYAKQRDDTEILKKIEQYYQTRIANAKTLEKVHWILENKKKEAALAIRKYRNENDKVDIFGAGSVGLECFRFLQEMNVPINCFLDNDGSKHGSMVMEKPIQKCVRRENHYIVVAVMNYQEEIINQLEEMGYRNKEDFCMYYDIVQKVYEKVKEGSMQC